MSPPASSDPTPARPHARSSRTERAALLVLLAALPLLTTAAQSQLSATFDETINLVPGLHMLATGDRSVPVDYAPLTRLLAAGAVRLSGFPVHYDPASLPGWSPGLFPEHSQRVLFLENDADGVLFRARLAFLPIHLVLAVAVWSWARRLWEGPGGLLALTLFALAPAVLAHAPLVTNDLTVTAFVFLGLVAAERAARRLTLARTAAAGLAFGVALLAKYSALFALAVACACLVGRALLREPWVVGAGARSLATVRARLAAATAAGVLVVATAFTVVWAGYGFRHAPWPDGDPQAAAKREVVEAFRAQNRLESAAQRAAIAVLDHARLLPEPYVLGVEDTLKHMERRLAFFLGERSVDGWLAYFPVAFALKTPLPTLVVLATVLVALATRRLRVDGVTALFAGVFPVLYVATCIASRMNLGERYLLPAYPFLYVLAGGMATLATTRARRAALVGLVAWLTAGTLRVHPDYLAYFNEAAGGPRGGIRFLGGSNLDWGQGLARLGPWLRERGVRHVKLGYFGTALPEYYAREHGFTFERTEGNGYLNTQVGTRIVREGDWLVVGATCLQGTFFPDPTVYRFLDAFEPVDVIGHVLYVYRIDRALVRPLPPR